jgi:hypothetical protein
MLFLFWNMGGRVDEEGLPRRARGREGRLASILANLARLHNVDLMILAECPLGSSDILAAANAGGVAAFREPDPNSLCERIRVFPRIPGRFVRLRQESEKYTCREVRLPGLLPFTFFAVHFGSKLFKDDESQSQAMPGFSSAIRQQEKE